MQNFLGIVVGVGHVPEFDDALDICQILRVRRILFRLRIHDFQKTLEAADTVLELLHEADQSVHGIDEQVHGHDEGRVIAEGNPARVQEQATRDEDEHIEDIRHESGGGVEHGHGPVGPAGSVHELPVALPELLDLPLAVGVGLCHADAGDAALHRGVDGGIALAAVVKGAAHCLAEVQGHHHQNRYAGEDDQGQYRVDHYQVDEGQDDHHGADQQVFRAVVGQFAHLE